MLTSSHMIYGNFKFNKAGQGCFYTGSLQRGDTQFNFVYDCGSRKGAAILQDEIRSYRDTLRIESNNSLDLVVISHLDADHVNQLHHLLKNLNRCKRVILPYISSLERIFIYFNNGQNDGTDDTEFSSFITNPAAYLIGLNVEEVIFITGNSDENPSSMNIGDVPPDSLREDPFTSDDQNGFQYSSRLVQILPENQSSQQKELYEGLGEDAGRVKFYKANEKIVIGNVWEFFLYNKEQSPELIAGFIGYIQNQFGIILTDDGLTLAQAQDILGNSNLRSKIKREFIATFGDCNSTGLILMHGPLNSRYQWLEMGREHVLRSIEDSPSFTLLNGDIYLSTINYPQHIIQNLSNIKLFQVPHHGATPNWEKTVIATLAESCLIINYGIGNRYGHPGLDVKREILLESHKWQLVENTQLQDFNYHIVAHY